MTNIPSFHDDVLVGYHVESESRRITLLIRSESDSRGSPPRMTLTFTGVVGYWLTGDTFTNYIYSIEETSPDRLVKEFEGAIEGLVEQHGLPREEREPSRAAHWILEKNLRCFAIDASMGLWGWIVARDVEFAGLGAAPSAPER